MKAAGVSAGTSRAGLLIAQAALAFGCLPQQPEHREELARARATISATATRTHGFESLEDWSPIYSSPLLALSNAHSEGLKSLAVSGGGWSSFISRKLSNEGPAPTVVGFDLLIPLAQPNPSWFGSVQLFVDIPSRGINSQPLGLRDLKAWTPGQWKRAEFTLPPAIRAALDRPFTDLRWRIELNRPSSAVTAYLFDSFRLGSAAPICTPASDGNPCTIDGCDAGGNQVHTAVAAGTSCQDGNACNGTESCNAVGQCVAGTAVSCVVSDQCHERGLCNPTTGACTNPAKAEGTACGSGGSCGGGQVCLSGVCLNDAAAGPVELCPDGSVTTQFASIQALPGALVEPIEFSVAPVPMPDGLPADFLQVGPAVDVGPTGDVTLDVPVTVGLPYDPAAVSSGLDVSVMHYTDEDGWGFLGKTALDLTLHTVSFQAREFSIVVPVVATTQPPANGFTAFEPSLHGWPIENFDGPFGENPSGTDFCFGMTNYAMWSWRYIRKPLHDTYSFLESVAGAFSVAQLVAMRATFIEQPLNHSFSPLMAPHPSLSVRTLKTAIGVVHTPVVLGLVGPIPGHSVIAIAYHGDVFDVWDPDRGVTTLTYDQSQAAFLPYHGLTTVIPLPAAVYWSNQHGFYDLWREATATPPFSTSTTIKVTSPQAGEVVRDPNPLGLVALDLRPFARGYVYIDSPKPAVRFLQNGSTQGFMWSPPEGENELLFFAGWPELETSQGATLIRKFIVCRDPTRPVWNGTSCEGCPTGQSWQNGACGCPTGTEFCGGQCVNAQCSGGQVFDTNSCDCKCPSNGTSCRGGCFTPQCGSGQLFSMNSCACVDSGSCTSGLHMTSLGTYSMATLEYDGSTCVAGTYTAEWFGWLSQSWGPNGVSTQAFFGTAGGSPSARQAVIDSSNGSPTVQCRAQTANDTCGTITAGTQRCALALANSDPGGISASFHLVGTTSSISLAMPPCMP
jgi:hypothetical protein